MKGKIKPLWPTQDELQLNLSQDKVKEIFDDLKPKLSDKLDTDNIEIKPVKLTNKDE